ncbi:hypothetical protein GGR56DRAFT_613363 [Xylariaceae sp. FL0804]|nr:hypothetical protein GGR56DRAFT_613363 [Xylariaceae sp. FL0804]
MSNYSGRRGQAVNVSQLLQDLNRIPDPQPQPAEENLPSLDDELAMFTNTNFIDWDAAHEHGRGQQPPVAALGVSPQSSTSGTTEGVSPNPIGDLASFDFNMPGGFHGFDFPPFSTSNTFSDNLASLPPIQPAYSSSGSPQNVYDSQIRHGGPGVTTPSGRQMPLPDQVRLSAEEDKRRRNTAASARFRVKKKQREQALEQREKELADKVSNLETKIKTLETENKWLKDIVMGKTGSGESEISAMLDKQKGSGEPSVSTNAKRSKIPASDANS